MSFEVTMLRIELPWACFGLVVQGGRVVRAAPIARWCVGKPVDDVTAYWHRRGATIERL